jgi:beta-glucosidase
MMDYDIRRGRTYMYFKGEPLYPFGHGLSYSTFVCSNLHVSAPTVAAGSPISVSLDVRNSSRRPGDEVVQVYAAYPSSAVTRPARQLIGFRRISIAPGETKTITLPIRAGQLAYWNASERGFVIEPGTVDLLAGASSADIRLRGKIQVLRP